MSSEVRPRRGELRTTDGRGRPVVVPILFEPDPIVPDRFYATTTAGGPVEYSAGDTVWVDVLGPGQTVTLRFPLV